MRHKNLSSNYPSGHLNKAGSAQLSTPSAAWRDAHWVISRRCGCFKVSMGIGGWVLLWVFLVSSSLVVVLRLDQMTDVLWQWRVESPRQFFWRLSSCDVEQTNSPGDWRFGLRRV
jgi:hypothetical protein